MKEMGKDRNVLIFNEKKGSCGLCKTFFKHGFLVVRYGHELSLCKPCLNGIKGDK